jgi:nitroimidazol reductase NimA-like FMN-containing flavoprotein (pyridoxamine 5'-phosphate oxidase superfamily)
VEIDANGLEVLSRAECADLLRTKDLGRIAITSGALPVILPVNYVVVGDDIVLRTRKGTTLAAATRHAIVAFEVDVVDEVTGAGWSVMVQGRARELDDAPTGIDLAAPLARWRDHGEDRHVAVAIEVVSGRRIPALPDAPDPT